MRCRFCSSTNTRVIVTERHGNETWRYQRCFKCHCRFKTIECYSEKKRGSPPGQPVHPNQVKKGEQVASSVLTEENVIEIRRLAKEEKKTYVTIAAQFGIHKDTVYRIVKRKLWKHI